MDMEREKRAEKIKFQFCCIVIFLLVLGCMLFLGCTATPKENEEKDLNILSEKQERDTGEDGEGETLLMQKLNVPEKLETEKKSKDGKKTLLINAAVEVPKTAAIPLRDIEPRAYKEKEVDEIIKKLFPGELKSEEKAGQGDEDRAILIDVNGEVETGDKTNVIFAAEDVYTTTVSLKAYNGEKYFLDLYDYAKVSKSQSESLFFPHAVLLSRDMAEYDDVDKTEEEIKNEGYPLPSVSQDEAVKLAKEAMELCHLYDYRLFSASYVASFDSDDDNAKKQTGRLLHFVKEVDGIPVFNLPSSREKDTEGGNAKYWGTEGVDVTVDKSGVVQIFAGSDGMVKEEGRSEELLAFDEIEKVAEAALLKKEEGEWTTVVEQVALGYARVWKQEEEKQEGLVAQLRPAWVFYGKCSGKISKKETYSEYGDRNLQVAVDAATGEVLDVASKPGTDENVEAGAWIWEETKE